MSNIEPISSSTFSPEADAENFKQHAPGCRSYVMAIMDYDEEGELQVAFSTAGTRMDILYCAEVIKANYGPGRGGD